MAIWRRLESWLSWFPWYRRQARDADLARELRDHLDLEADEQKAAGLSPKEAAHAAHRALGNTLNIEEDVREAWGLQWLETLVQDIRYGLRTLRKSPGFTAVAVITLALGIGSVAAIFSIADTSLLNPLPFPHSERLVSVHEVVPMITNRPIRITAPDLVDYENESRLFEALGGWRTPSPQTVELSGGRESTRVSAIRFTPNVFRVLEVWPALGRAFTVDEDKMGERVCVISYGLWQRWFGADPHALGQTVDLDREPFKVIGVMPRGFEFPLHGTADTPDKTDVWLPLSLTPKQLADRADNWSYNGVARMKPGVTLEQATADVDTIAQRIVNERLPADATAIGFKFSALVLPLSQQVTGRVRPVVLALLGAVAFVLLIACANVANLLLARGAQREREIALRVTLGASGLRIIRQLVVETMILAGFAALLGTLLAWRTTETLSRFVPKRFAVLAQAQFNWRVLLVTAGIALLTAITVGVIPGLAAANGLPSSTLKGRGASAWGTRHRKLRSTLVVTETSLALVLLVGAGLLIRSFHDLLSTDPGFAPENAVSGFVSLPENQYPDATHERLFYRDLLERIQAAPGTEFAGMATAIPLNGPSSERSFWPDDYAPPPNARMNIASMTAVSAQYLQAIGATLLRGRFFTPQDTASELPVAIITESIAKQYWPGKDPVGKRIRLGIRESENRKWMTVVGVVADLKQYSLENPSDPQIFMASDQLEQEESNPANDPQVTKEIAAHVSGYLRSMYVVVRGHSSAQSLAADLKNAVRGLDSRLAIASLQPLTETVAASAAPQRFNMLMMTGFGGIALLLAAIGIYGLISYSVSQRTHEIGVRVALGAKRTTVLGLILRQALELTMIGVGICIAGALALTQLLSSLLFGVKPTDPLTFIVVSLTLLGVAALASYIPARRAMRVDPMVALRYE